MTALGFHTGRRHQTFPASATRNKPSKWMQLLLHAISGFSVMGHDGVRITMSGIYIYASTVLPANSLHFKLILEFQRWAMNICRNVWHMNIHTGAALPAIIRCSCCFKLILELHWWAMTICNSNWPMNTNYAYRRGDITTLRCSFCIKLALRFR